MNLGSRLKQLLDERGWTVTRFSREAGIPAQTVYALINRDSNKADMDILMKLLTALDMDFFTFMGAGTTVDADASTAPDTASGSSAVPEHPAERVVEKVVEKVVVKEVPTAAPAGKQALYINSDTYEKVMGLAAEEGLTDEAILDQVIEEYMKLGFGYRQKPLRSILRDMKPRSGRSRDMDSYLL